MANLVSSLVGITALLFVSKGNFIGQIITIIFAKFIGCTLPILAKKLGFDPTVMAGPFITTLVDAISLFVYFSIATNMLGL